MKKIILVLALTFSSLLSNKWDQIFDRYRGAVNNSTYALIKKQYESFVSGNAFAISNSIIKKIEIKECGEELVDLRKVQHLRISVMEESEFSLAHQCKEDIDPRAARHAEVRKSVFEVLKKMIDELDKIAPAFGYEPGDLEIKLFEGLRDIATQKKLFDTKMESILKSNPGMTQEEAYAETSKWVSPYKNNVPTHSTGAAIDIHIWSKKLQKFCDMGRFNGYGNDLAPIFSQNPQLTETQAMNRFMLITAATSAGLVNYIYEWWHFSLGDRYSAFWLSKDFAIYNSI